jgi:hypothetical protein
MVTPTSRKASNSLWKFAETATGSTCVEPSRSSGRTGPTTPLVIFAADNSDGIMHVTDWFT